MRNRGQSEVVGFVLVFGIILLGITLATVTGQTGLDNAREYERTSNAERAFSVLADNVGDVTRRGSPSRTTEFKLANAKLSLGDPITVTVRGEHVSDSGENFTHTATIHPIVYSSESGTNIAYGSGATIRSEEEGSVVIGEPNFVITEDAVILPIVRTWSEDGRAVGGRSTIDVRTVYSGEELVSASNTPHVVTLNVTSPRADAWERYLDSESDTDCSRSDETVSCVVSTERVYVVTYRVDIRFG